MAVDEDQLPIKLRDLWPDDALALVKILATYHPRTWDAQGGALWKWKHAQRTGFRPDDIVVAVHEDTPVGCFHSAVLPLLIENGLAVPMSFDGDYAVLSTARGQDLTRRAYEMTDARLLARGVVFRGGFTSRELNERLYGKFGYVFAPTATTTFRKFLDVEPLRAKVARVGEQILKRRPSVREILAKRPLVVNLAIKDLPRMRLNCSDGQVVLEAGWFDGASLEVHAPYDVLVGVVEGPRSLIRRSLRAAATGHLRIRGLFRTLPAVVSLCVAALRR